MKGDKKTISWGFRREGNVILWEKTFCELGEVSQGNEMTWM